MEITEEWLEDHIEKRRTEMNMTLEDLNSQAETMYYAYLQEWCRNEKIDWNRHTKWENLKDTTKLFYRHRVVRDI